MKKLLHERLWEHDGIGTDFECNDRLLSLRRSAARALADEIDRYYIPREEYDQLKETKTDGAHYIMKTWAEERGCPMKKNETITHWLDRYYVPRHTDSEGNPWLIGDKAIDGEGEEFIVQGYGYDGEYPYLVNVDSGTVYGGQWCTRPSPKFLDHDGVEIKKGDTVWSKGGAKYIVEEIEDEDKIHLRRPYEDKALVKMPANCLTHKEPDNLEKLRDDIANFTYEGMFGGLIDVKAKEWVGRLSALIEKTDQ